MATVQRYVNTDSTAGGDGTTNGTAGPHRAYASLSEWEANVNGLATDDFVVDCCGSTADTAAVTVDFATNITSGSVTIRANRDDINGFYHRSTTAIDGNNYKLGPTGSGTTPLITLEPNVTVDGIQIETNGGTNGWAAINLVPNASGGVVKNCRIRASSGTSYGIYGGNFQSITHTIENNLIIGFDTAQIDLQVNALFTPTITIRHNTLYGDGSASGIHIVEAASGQGSYTIKGNAIGNTGASNAFNISLSLGTATYDDNATEDAQGTTGEIAIGTLTDAWVNPGTGQTADFNVKDTNSSLYAAVNPTLVTTDITNYLRDGTNHDVGAFELRTTYRPAVDYVQNGWTAFPGPFFCDMLNETSVDETNYIRSPALSASAAPFRGTLDVPLPAGNYIVDIDLSINIVGSSVFRVRFLDFSFASVGVTSDQAFSSTSPTTFNLNVALSDIAYYFEIEPIL